MEEVLIVEDSPEIQTQFKWGLKDNYGLLFATSVDEALRVFRRKKPKVVILDLGLPPKEDSPEEGLRCLEAMLGIDPLVKTVVVTGNNEREYGLKAIQLGAYDFYQKPVKLEELKIIIKRAFHLYRLEKENRYLQEELQKKSTEFGTIVGQCPQMQEVFSTIRKVASSDVSVLVLGESGTGKELVARAIHSLSYRREGPFISINCGAIPENLLESELFGFERGAFTGAYTRVRGKIEYADRGTLFLDEIGELSQPLQVKLLRFLQDKSIQRVGGREDIPVDTRIIAATNRDLEQEVRDGRFREDLYYRLGVVTIKLPPLRQRGEDILLLANLFLYRFSSEFRKPVRGFTTSAIDTMKGYHWPGNVRELENRVQRAVIMAESPLIGPADLGFDSELNEYNASFSLEDLTLKEAKNQLERLMVLKVLRESEGNVARAAARLGVSRPTLYDLIKKHSIDT